MEEESIGLVSPGSSFSSYNFGSFNFSELLHVQTKVHLDSLKLYLGSCVTTFHIFVPEIENFNMEMTRKRPYSCIRDFPRHQIRVDNTKQHNVENRTNK